MCPCFVESRHFPISGKLTKGKTSKGTEKEKQGEIVHKQCKAKHKMFEVKAANIKKKC